MSFIESAKTEIVGSKLEQNFAVARLSGFFACGTHSIVKHEPAKQHIKELLAQTFSYNWDGQNLPQAIFDALQIEIDEYSIRQYITGYFLAYANGSIKTGYNIHLVHSENIGHLLAEFDIFCKTASGIIYIKELDSISNLLVLVGATRSVLQLNNLFALREVRKNANRITNAESANIERQVTASINVIEKLKNININNLNDKLKAVAKARIENPDLTLQELATKIGISKSCLNHRLRKILCYN